jgi:hypothetical protein
VQEHPDHVVEAHVLTVHASRRAPGGELVDRLDADEGVVRGCGGERLIAVTGTVRHVPAGAGVADADDVPAGT